MFGITHSIKFVDVILCVDTVKRKTNISVCLTKFNENQRPGKFKRAATRLRAMLLLVRLVSHRMNEHFQMCVKCHENV